MTNMQLLFTAGMPTLAVLVGILLNQVQMTRLDKRLDESLATLGLIQRDQREFYAAQRLHELRLDVLEKKEGK